MAVDFESNWIGVFLNCCVIKNELLRNYICLLGKAAKRAVIKVVKVSTGYYVKYLDGTDDSDDGYV